MSRLERKDRIKSINNSFAIRNLICCLAKDYVQWIKRQNSPEYEKYNFSRVSWRAGGRDTIFTKWKAKKKKKKKVAIWQLVLACLNGQGKGGNGFFLSGGLQH